MYNITDSLNINSKIHIIMNRIRRIQILFYQEKRTTNIYNLPKTNI